MSGTAHRSGDVESLLMRRILTLCVYGGFDHSCQDRVPNSGNRPTSGPRQLFSNMETMT
jgi:hypothetical protein